jgi:hypothetical protein
MMMIERWEIPDALPLPEPGEPSPIDVVAGLASRATSVLDNALSLGGAALDASAALDALAVRGALARLDPGLAEACGLDGLDARLDALIQRGGPDLIHAALTGIDFVGFDRDAAQIRDFDLHAEMDREDAAGLARQVLSRLDDATLAVWAAERALPTADDQLAETRREVSLRWEMVTTDRVAFVDAWDWIRATALSFDPIVGQREAPLLQSVHCFEPLLEEITNMLADGAERSKESAEVAPSPQERALVLPLLPRIRLSGQPANHQGAAAVLPLRPPHALAASTSARVEVRDDLVRDPVDIANLGDSILEIASRRATVELRVYGASKDAVRCVRLSEKECLEPDANLVWKVRIPWPEDPVLLRVDLENGITYETLVVFMTAPPSDP